MRQLSLFETAGLAGVMPAIRASMRRVAAKGDGEGRKVLVDRINEVAQRECISLTGGNAKCVSLDTLEKVLNPNESGHPPSINMILAFCKATGDVSVLQELLRPFGLGVQTAEDKRLRDIAKADAEIEALKKRRKHLKEAL